MRSCRSSTPQALFTPRRSSSPSSPPSRIHTRCRGASPPLVSPSRAAFPSSVTSIIDRAASGPAPPNSEDLLSLNTHIAYLISPAWTSRPPHRVRSALARSPSTAIGAAARRQSRTSRNPRQTRLAVIASGRTPARLILMLPSTRLNPAVRNTLPVTCLLFQRPLRMHALLTVRTAPEL